MKPIILITPTRGEQTDRYRCRYQLAELYAACIRSAGAVPLIACGGEARDYTSAADAILFSGGGDVHPSIYGEDILNDSVVWDSQRDEEELALFSAFRQAEKPIFGICRGIQLINAALGGTLWQDLPTQIPDVQSHAGDAVHPVSVTDGTILAEIFQKSVLTVNSFHHQAVKALGTGLKTNAVSDDGVIEGIESEDGQILAVQWHPERITFPDMYDGRDCMAPFFHEMVKRTERNKR